MIVAAGSLGSTKLLLRMKASGLLPNLGPALGKNWSENGDLLGFSIKSSDPIYPSTGPVITGAIRFFHARYPDGFPHGLYIEDAGIPNFLAWYLTAMTPTWQSILAGLKGGLRYLRGLLFGRREVNLGDDLGLLLFRESELASRTMIFLGMGRDRSTGCIQLRPKSAAPLTWQDDFEHPQWNGGGDADGLDHRDRGSATPVRDRSSGLNKEPGGEL